MHFLNLLQSLFTPPFALFAVKPPVFGVSNIEDTLGQWKLFGHRKNGEMEATGNEETSNCVMCV